MAEIFKSVTGAAYVHVFHHQLCADRHNADGNARFYSVLRGTQRTSTVCPTAGAQALTMSSLMTWYPCLRASTALQSAVLASVLFSPKAEGTDLSLYFYLTVSAFGWSCCLVLFRLVFLEVPDQASEHRAVTQVQHCFLT